jgi:hypothetical protein
LATCEVAKAKIEAIDPNLPSSEPSEIKILTPYIGQIKNLYSGKRKLKIM